MQTTRIKITLRSDHQRPPFGIRAFAPTRFPSVKVLSRVLRLYYFTSGLCGQSSHSGAEWTVITAFQLSGENGMVAGHLQGRRPRETPSWKMEQLGAGYPRRLL